jgi:hypothetical protein
MKRYVLVSGFFILFFYQSIFADVGNTGEFTYKYELKVQKGISGLNPKLELNYDSRSGNGLTGYGWQLSGIPKIQRINQGKGIKNSTNDTFTGPNGILVEVEPGVYHYQNDNLSKITFSGNCGNGPCQFIENDKNGHTIFYGSENPSSGLCSNEDACLNSQTHGQTAVIWYAYKISDANENYYSIKYTKNSSNLNTYVKSIDYTINDSFPISKKHHINFKYRSDRPDVLSILIGDTVIVTDQLLEKIELSDDCYLLLNCTIKSYKINYDTSRDNKSKLISIIEKGKNGEDLPGTFFTWSGKASSNSVSNFQYTNLWKIAVNSDTGPTLISMDANSDGITDICGVDATGIICAINNKQGVSTQSTRYTNNWGLNNYSPENHILFAIDINGDGSTDICGVDNTGILCEINNGYGVSTGSVRYTNKWGFDWGNAGQHKIFSVDINSDGLTDFCGVDETGISCEINDGTGKSSGTVQFTTNWGLNWKSAQNHYLFPVDINSDSKIDICEVDDTGIVCALNDGTGKSFEIKRFTTSWSFAWQPVAQHKLFAVDINNDGAIDVCGIHDTGIL